MKYGAVTRLSVSDGNSLIRKRSYFLRVVMRYDMPEQEVNLAYSHEEEIFIDYDFL